MVKHTLSAWCESSSFVSWMTFTCILKLTLNIWLIYTLSWPNGWANLLVQNLRMINLSSLLSRLIQIWCFIHEIAIITLLLIICSLNSTSSWILSNNILVSTLQISNLLLVFVYRHLIILTYQLINIRSFIQTLI